MAGECERMLESCQLTGDLDSDYNAFRALLHRAASEAEEAARAGGGGPGQSQEGPSLQPCPTAAPAETGAAVVAVAASSHEVPDGLVASSSTAADTAHELTAGGGPPDEWMDIVITHTSSIDSSVGGGSVGSSDADDEEGATRPLTFTIVCRSVMGAAVWAGSSALAQHVPRILAAQQAAAAATACGRASNCEGSPLLAIELGAGCGLVKFATHSCGDKPPLSRPPAVCSRVCVRVCVRACLFRSLCAWPRCAPLLTCVIKSVAPYALRPGEPGDGGSRVRDGGDRPRPAGAPRPRQQSPSTLPE